MRKKTRTKIVALRLSEFENEQLQNILEITNQSASSFIRNAMLEKIQKLSSF